MTWTCKIDNEALSTHFHGSNPRSTRMKVEHFITERFSRTVGLQSLRTTLKALQPYLYEPWMKILRFSKTLFWWTTLKIVLAHLICFNGFDMQEIINKQKHIPRCIFDYLSFLLLNLSFWFEYNIWHVNNGKITEIYIFKVV